MTFFVAKCCSQTVRVYAGRKRVSRGRHVLFRVLVLLFMCWNGFSTPGLAGATSASASREPYRYFPETGHTIGGLFKMFYDRHGGLPIFGLPLTEAFVEDGIQVQYFERARFELRPELPAGENISLTLIGSLLTQNRSEAAFAWLSESPTPDRDFFPESGHTLGGVFRSFWRAHGGLPVFGYPISEEFSEISPIDGQAYLVQYFQRARFEYHPERSGTPAEVQLGLLGSEYARQRNLAPDLLAPAQPIVKLAAATTTFPASSAGARNIALAAAQFDDLIVKPGQTVSFLDTIGEVTKAAGYTEGYAIINGQLEKTIGGGICQVSTALYRAVFSAGLEIIERHPHSRMLDFFADAPGLEAAVYIPGTDLRWRNDTPYDIHIVTHVDQARESLTIVLWGISDGRKTRIHGPAISKQQEPGAATWRYDETLPPGETRTLIRARDGLDATVKRTVTAADGTLLHRNSFNVHYAPWNELVVYGPDVVPPPEVRLE